MQKTMEDPTLKAKCFNVLKEIREILEKTNSSDPLVRKHDYNHALDVYLWLTLLHPDKEISFHIAALGHDIERSFEEKRANQKDFQSHKEFKEAHSKNSAEILKKIMLKYNLPTTIIEKTVNLVLKHEFGGDPDSNIIMNMDCLGNIIWCERVIEKYADETTVQTMNRMIQKMDIKHKEIIPHLKLKTKLLWSNLND
jgi:hypothetical protein